MLSKELFLHDLAVVAILKDEDNYLKEWLDYHLAAGVSHFFLYDNANAESTREILKPYIEAHFVDYFPATGSLMQMPVYNDAVRRFKFICRYMAFIDLDEFIFPKTGQSIVEVVDEVLSRDPRATALAINWQIFGSNGQETADYSKGVLERFTRRAPESWFVAPTENSLPVGNIHIKTIANPRYIRYIVNPHYAYYFNGKFAVNSAGGRVTHWGNEPVLTDKIVVNHYFDKSKEEFQTKISRGREGVDNPDFAAQTVNMEAFERNDRNDIFDDDILTYRELRSEVFEPPKSYEREEYFQTLEKILLPAVRSDAPDEFFEGKLELFLTCRALAGILKRSYPKDNRGRFMEEAALRALNRTHFTKLSFAEIMMMLNALPAILVLPYPSVADIRKNCMSFVRQVMSDYHRISRWESFVDMGNYLEMLAAFNAVSNAQNAMRNEQ